MTVVRIPTSIVESSYVQRTSLDGREYQLTFQWNQRESKWYLDIRDQDGDDIVVGIKLVANFSLVARVADARIPPGMLIASDLTVVPGDGKTSYDPGLRELGTRVVLLYYPVADIEALDA
jgi:hypothetical protein